MNEAVFISDLHLHPGQPELFKKFQHFVHWAETHTHSVYILGDFLHVWPGDDAIDHWSQAIIQLLAGLHDKGVTVYFMPGNRDFLLGSVFLQQAKVIPLEEPAVIFLNEQRVLLVHGDRYCTHDRSHQWFRSMTRRPRFKRWFLRLPYALRAKIVNQVRQYSQSNHRKTKASMQIVDRDMLAEMDAYQSYVLIHGHIHQAGLAVHQYQGLDFQQYVLSDWDENPSVLCYNKSRFMFSNFLRGLDEPITR